jgi:hypothetical protein
MGLFDRIGRAFRALGKRETWEQAVSGLRDIKNGSLGTPLSLITNGLSYTPWGKSAEMIIDALPNAVEGKLGGIGAVGREVYNHVKK